ncbi:ArnT family glycosyltransferase [Fervidibacter sp.]|jgi:4-amino-4-deoxy-L-arabinose transferase-like glycosyltransferase
MARYTTTLWALLALAIFLCFWGNDKTPLFDTDEPRYAQAAKEMMQRGDWVLPTFNGQPRYAKPVMFYWLLIAAYKIFGVNEFAARFWSGVAAMVIALLLYFALRTIFGQESALAASLCWLTSIAALIFAHAAITDMVLVAFMTGAIIALWVGLVTNCTFWFLLASVSMGFAVLTKGPVGVVLPLMVFAVSAIIHRPTVSVPLRHLVAIGVGCLILFLATVLPWYVAVSIRTNGEFLRQFFLVENVSRYAQGSKLPLWVHLAYFPATAFVLAFPWSAFGIWMLSSLSGLTDEQKQWLTLLKVWAILPVLVFSFSQTKNPQYVLLAVPALTSLGALLLTLPIPSEASCELWLLKRRFALLTWFSLTLAAAALIISSQPLINSVPNWRVRLAGDGFVDFGWSRWAVSGFVLVMCIAGLLALLKIRAFSLRHFFLISVASMLAIHAVALGAFVPKVGYYRQEPLKHFAETASSQLKRDDLLVVYRRDLSSVVFYSNRRVLRVDDPSHLIRLLRQNRRVDVLTHVRFSSDLERLKGVKLHLVERCGAFLWLSNRDAGCPIHR